MPGPGAVGFRSGLAVAVAVAVAGSGASGDSPQDQIIFRRFFCLIPPHSDAGHTRHHAATRTDRPRCPWLLNSKWALPRPPPHIPHRPRLAGSEAWLQHIEHIIEHNTAKGAPPEPSSHQIGHRKPRDRAPRRWRQPISWYGHNRPGLRPCCSPGPLFSMEPPRGAGSIDLDRKILRWPDTAAEDFPE